jgi:hypothetical protein
MRLLRPELLREEDFGDGIMSAIDFEIQIEREPNSEGDRVRSSCREVSSHQPLLGSDQLNELIR